MQHQNSYTYFWRHLCRLPIYESILNWRIYMIELVVEYMVYVQKNPIKFRVEGSLYIWFKPWAPPYANSQTFKKQNPTRTPTPTPWPHGPWLIVDKSFAPISMIATHFPADISSSILCFPLPKYPSSQSSSLLSNSPPSTFFTTILPNQNPLASGDQSGRIIGYQVVQVKSSNRH